MFHRILPALILLGSFAPLAATAAPSAPPQQAREAAERSQAARKKALEAMLHQVSAPAGIRYTIAPGLARDPVPARLTGTDWPEVVGNLLRGYNWVGTWDERGRLRAVSVTGRKGDGAMPPAAAGPAKPASGDLLAYRENTGRIPVRYRSLKPGSVYRVEIPVDRLRHMPKGTRVSLNLPDGRYEVVHDNQWPHGNGDLTWAGYMDGPAGGPYRALLTMGENGIEGLIRTPGGQYQLESDGTQTWLVDIDASGLRAVSLEGDQHAPAAFLPGAAAAPAPTLTAQYAPGRSGNSPAAARPEDATFNAAGQPIVDVTILYTGGLANKRILTRLNHLVALANQALSDSRVKARLRLAAARRTGYPNGGSNDAALTHLTLARRALRAVPRLRQQTGADIVLLARPFLPRSQDGSCGVAWVNGADGTELSPEMAFGVIGMGSYGNYYCPAYTLAHETGHVLGATHDRAHSDISGAFDFSYGFGIPGLFGDIMSYIDPGIGIYANPALSCVDHACGIPAGRPNAADVALTFNRTAATVSGFVRAVNP